MSQRKALRPRLNPIGSRVKTPTTSSAGARKAWASASVRKRRRRAPAGRTTGGVIPNEVVDLLRRDQGRTLPSSTVGSLAAAGAVNVNVNGSLSDDEGSVKRIGVELDAAGQKSR